MTAKFEGRWCDRRDWVRLVGAIVVESSRTGTKTVLAIALAFGAVSFLPGGDPGLLCTWTYGWLSLVLYGTLVLPRVIVEVIRVGAFLRLKNAFALRDWVPGENVCAREVEIHVPAEEAMAFLRYLLVVALRGSEEGYDNMGRLRFKVYRYEAPTRLVAVDTQDTGRLYVRVSVAEQMGTYVPGEPYFTAILLVAILIALDGLNVIDQHVDYPGGADRLRRDLGMWELDRLTPEVERLWRIDASFGGTRQSGRPPRVR